MKTNPIIALILVIIGASLQNIIWYIRLQNPYLLREFQMYWAEDGARLFLDFNIMNYFFLMLAIILYAIVYLINRKRKKTNDALVSGDEQ